MRLVYLIHFARPYQHARHYVGSTDNLDARLADHAAGRGARLMEVVTQAGIEWSCVRTWEGGRTEERRHNLKAAALAISLVAY
jgi:predicted GIY-YIG superfamily endonuclease